MNTHHANIGGFFVIELSTNRILKEHKHLKTAINHAKRIGLDKAVIKPVADREAWFAERMGQNYVRDTQRC